MLVPEEEGRGAIVSAAKPCACPLCGKPATAHTFPSGLRVVACECVGQKMVLAAAARPETFDEPLWLRPVLWSEHGNRKPDIERSPFMATNAPPLAIESSPDDEEIAQLMRPSGMVRVRGVDGEEFDAVLLLDHPIRQGKAKLP